MGGLGRGRWVSRDGGASPADRRPLAFGECPGCRLAYGEVYCTKGPVQYRRCPSCGGNFKTARPDPPSSADSKATP